MDLKGYTQTNGHACHLFKSPLYLFIHPWAQPEIYPDFLESALPILSFRHLFFPSLQAEVLRSALGPADRAYQHRQRNSGNREPGG